MKTLAKPHIVRRNGVWIVSNPMGCQVKAFSDKERNRWNLAYIHVATMNRN